MKKYIVSAVKFAVSLGIGVALVVWFFGQMSASDKAQVANDIKRANYLWVIIPPVIGLISNFFRTQRWRLMLRPLGQTPGFWNTFHSIMIMYFMNLFFPRAGEVSRCAILLRYENVPLDKGIGTMVVERLLDVICLAVVALILLIGEHEKFIELYNLIASNSQSTFGDIIAKYQISATVKYAVFGTAGLLIAIFVGVRIFKKGLRSNIETLKDRLKGLAQGIISIKDVGSPFTFLFHTVMIWVCYFTMAYFGLKMFPETSGLGLMAAGVILFFGAVANSITPGGLGLYPIFIQIILSLYGVVGSAATSLGLVAWTAQTFGVLAAGVISLIILAIINRTPAFEKEPLKA